jgi:hypothetical protein
MDARVFRRRLDQEERCLVNHAKLEALGLQAAIRACIRHSKAVERGSHAAKHLELRILCNAVACKLWERATDGERQRMDLNSGGAQ